MRKILFPEVLSIILFSFNGKTEQLVNLNKKEREEKKKEENRKEGTLIKDKEDVKG